MIELIDLFDALVKNPSLEAVGKIADYYKVPTMREDVNNLLYASKLFTQSCGTPSVGGGRKKGKVSDEKKIILAKKYYAYGQNATNVWLWTRKPEQKDDFGHIKCIQTIRTAINDGVVLLDRAGNTPKNLIVAAKIGRGRPKIYDHKEIADKVVEFGTATAVKKWYNDNGHKLAMPTISAACKEYKVELKRGRPFKVQ